MTQVFSIVEPPHHLDPRDLVSIPASIPAGIPAIQLVFLLVACCKCQPHGLHTVNTNVIAIHQLSSQRFGLETELRKL